MKRLALTVALLVGIGAASVGGGCDREAKERAEGERRKAEAVQRYEAKRSRVREVNNEWGKLKILELKAEADGRRLDDSAQRDLDALHAESLRLTSELKELEPTTRP